MIFSSDATATVAQVMKKRGSGGGSHSRGNSNEAQDCRPPKQQSNTWNIVGVAGGHQPPMSPPAPAADPCYETLKDYSDQNYPAYETLKNGRENESEPGYETVTGGKKHDEDAAEPGYETVNNRSCTVDAPEPGYETVKGSHRISDSEPGYETVAARVDQPADPGYETVHSRKEEEDNQPEPGYEQVHSISRRPPSECDSNYEQLKFHEQSEPGYESVKSCYENIADNNYERVSDYHTQFDSSSSPMYAEINKPLKSQPVYASVKKKSPEEKLALSLEKETGPSQDDIVIIEPPIMQEKILNGEEAEEEYVDETNLPEMKLRRSIEEEAAILVSTVEESAITILSSREKTSNGAADDVVASCKELGVDGEDLLVLTSSQTPNIPGEVNFTQKVQSEQPTTLPGLVSVAPDVPAEDNTNEASSPAADESVTNGHSDALMKTRSESAETDNGTKDINKASIEVQNGSAHSSVDNSSSGREDISPEDEVCLPPPEGLYDSTEQQLVNTDSSTQVSDTKNIVDIGATYAAHSEENDSNSAHANSDKNNGGAPGNSGGGKQNVVASLSVGEESSVEEETPLTPTVLSIPVPQSCFSYQLEEGSGLPPLSPPHACLLLDTDLPEQDQQSTVLPPPPPLMHDGSIPPPLEEDYNVSCMPPPPDLLSDAPECDLPPPMTAVDLPPPMVEPPPPLIDLLPPIGDLEQQILDQLASNENGDCEGTLEDLLPPPLPTVGAEDGIESITVTVNPMAEIDELASRVAKACRDSPITSPTTTSPPQSATTSLLTDDGDELRSKV